MTKNLYLKGLDKSAQINNYRLQPEETIQKYSRWQRAAGGGTGETYQTYNQHQKQMSDGNGIPDGFVRQFETKDGVKYSKHPAPPHYISDF